jgi:hypothetical protein
MEGENMTGSDLMAYTLIYMAVSSLAVAFISLITDKGEEDER